MRSYALLGQGLRVIVNMQANPTVAKCHILYTEQIFHNSLTQETSLAPKMYQIYLKGYFLGTVAESYRQSFVLFVTIYPKSTQSSKTVCFQTLFTPTFQYFYTDMYICHICDISQLWPTPLIAHRPIAELGLKVCLPS